MRPAARIVAEPDEHDTPAPIAWAWVGPILLVAAAAAAFGAGRYHLFGDELYFLAAGHHLSVGYADQGPILPLLALLGAAMPGDSLLLFRLPAVLLAVLGVLIAALVARELGGGRLAQALSAAAFATSSFLLLQSSLLATNAIDTPLWVAISWLLVRWVRTRQDRLLLAAGALTALDMQVKWLIPVFWVCVIAASLVWGPRQLIRRPALWAGGALTLLTMLPALLWQARRGWPYLQLTQQVAQEGQYTGGRLMFVPLMLLLAGFLAAPLLILGVIALLRSPELRPYRFLAPAFLLLVAVFIATSGRVYYPGGMFPVLAAAGAVAFERMRRRRWRWAAVPVVAIALGSLVSGLPFTPESGIPEPRTELDAALRISTYGQFGWPELASAAARSLSTVPPADRPGAVVTASYWQASALRYYGRDLPPVYSPDRGYGYFGQPSDSATTVLWIVETEAPSSTEMCASSRTLQHVRYRIGMPTASSDVDVRLCRVREPWSTLWPKIRSV